MTMNERALDRALIIELEKSEMLAAEFKVQMNDFEGVVTRYNLYKREVEENITSETFDEFLERKELQSKTKVGAANKVSTLSSYNASNPSAWNSSSSSTAGERSGGRVTCRIFGRTRMTSINKEHLQGQVMAINPKYMSTSEILEHSTSIFSKLQEHLDDGKPKVASEALTATALRDLARFADVEEDNETV